MIGHFKALYNCCLKGITPSYQEQVIKLNLKSLSSVLSSQPVYYCLGIGILLLLWWVPIGSAYAGWVSLGDTDLGTKVYVDPSNLLSRGNLVTMWILYDFRSMRTVAGKSYFSSKTHGEYDCAQKRHRTLSDTGFSSIMGLGKVVYNEISPTEWASITPESFDQTLWKFACGKH
jgi:hypothetical protein